MEIWKDIKGYEGLYKVSNLGNIKSLNFHRSGKEKIMKPLKRKDGYLKIQLFNNGKFKSYFVHRLVAEAFIDNPNNYAFINHKDENKKNNNAKNLEWCTIKYNNNYGNSKNKKFKKAKINQYTLDGKFIQQWETISQIQKEKRFSYYGIFNCLHNRQNTSNNFKWKYEVMENG